MLLSIVTALVLSLCPMGMGRPDPSGTSLYTATLFDHNEQGGVRWKTDNDCRSASVRFVGVTNDLDSKFAMACDPDAEYVVSFVIEYQSKLIDALPIPGYPTAWLGGVTVHPTANSQIDLGPIPVYQTSGTEWESTEPITVQGTFSGAVLNSSEFGLRFSAVQANDGAAFVYVRVICTVTER